MDFDTWKKEHDAKVAVLAEALNLMEKCEDVAQAKSALKMLHVCYSLQSYPYCLKKSRGTGDLSPAEIRRRVNSAWSADGSE
jgi:hypothetical protein